MPGSLRQVLGLALCVATSPSCSENEGDCRQPAIEVSGQVIDGLANELLVDEASVLQNGNTISCELGAPGQPFVCKGLAPGAATVRASTQGRTVEEPLDLTGACVQRRTIELLYDGPMCALSESVAIEGSVTNIGGTPGKADVSVQVGERRAICDSAIGHFSCPALVAQSADYRLYVGIDFSQIVHTVRVEANECQVTPVVVDIDRTQVECPPPSQPLARVLLKVPDPQIPGSYREVLPDAVQAVRGNGTPYDCELSEPSAQPGSRPYLCPPSYAPYGGSYTFIVHYEGRTMEEKEVFNDDGCQAQTKTITVFEPSR